MMIHHKEPICDVFPKMDVHSSQAFVTDVS
jgi:hypothetical protein